MHRELIVTATGRNPNRIRHIRYTRYRVTDSHLVGGSHPRRDDVAVSFQATKLLRSAFPFGGFEGELADIGAAEFKQLIAGRARVAITRCERNSIEAICNESNLGGHTGRLPPGSNRTTE